MPESLIPPSEIDPPFSWKSIPEVSVIIPARDEESNIALCLRSLLGQAGVAFEIIVVDDESSDRTPNIAKSFDGVKVVSAGSIAENGKRATGKNNAVIRGYAEARANWLLFTDADTIHKQGSLRRALDEAKHQGADLLSYSPEQIVVTFSERAVMPIIFSELSARYPLRRARSSQAEKAHCGLIAANGQYILVRRAAYESVGGHAAVASEILEDVALAQRFCTAGYRVRFRYGGEMVCTRMYKNWEQLREGWTKNLGLLFPDPTRLSFRCLAAWVLAWLSLATAIRGEGSRRHFRLCAAVVWLLAYQRVRRSNFSLWNSLIALTFGPPLFAYLLLRSSRAHQKGEVKWKGRIYAGTKHGLATSAGER